MSEYIVDTDGHEGHWLTGERIVRCCNCKYAKTTLHGMPAERVLVCTAHLRDFPTRDDGFCHLGRRRDA